MKTQSFVSVITLLLLLTTFLQAGVIPGRWEKLDSQPPGKEIIVTLNSGDRMEYTFKSSGPDDLTVTDPSGTERKVPKSEVQTIDSVEKTGDSLLNGTLIGAGVGGAISLFPLIYTMIRSDTDVGAGTMAFVGATIGFGAGMGAGIDAVYRRPEVLYQAPYNPAPSISSLSNNSTPAAVWVGRKDRLTLKIKGSYFIRQSVVRWNGGDRPTMFISGTELEAKIPAEDLKRAGAAPVTVFNPAPGGGTSDSITFTISK